jgi:hypothetical protein
MPTITPPEPVTASSLLHPIIWPNGRAIYRIETSRRYSANDMPLLRDAANKPMVLTEEVGIGSIVRLAIGDDGLLRAVQIMQAAYGDPFAASFAEAAD